MCRGRTLEADTQITKVTDGEWQIPILHACGARLSSCGCICRQYAVPQLSKRATGRCAAGLLDPKLRNLTCGQWVSINEANAANPYTDFCNVVGNACNAQGTHSRLDLDYS